MTPTQADREAAQRFIDDDLLARWNTTATEWLAEALCTHRHAALDAAAAFCKEQSKMFAETGGTVGWARACMAHEIEAAILAMKEETK